MKTLFKVSLGFLLLILSAGCATLPTTQSNWQTKKPDLHEIISITDEQGHLQGSQNILYSLSNDSANLYVKLMIADSKTQMKILRNGLKLWLDTTGHQKEKLGMIYPLASKENRIGEESPKRQQGQYGGMQDKASQIEMKRRMIFRMIEMDIIGFDGPEAVRVPALTNAGLGASLTIDSNGVIHYTAIIPFSLMHYNPALHVGKKSKLLTVGLETGKPEPIGSHGSEGGGSHGGGGGGGGMHGGGMGGAGGGGGGRHGGGGGQSATTYDEPIDLWMEVKLAKF